MRFDWKFLCGMVGGMMLLGISAATAIAADAYPVFTEIDATTGSFNGPWDGPFGAYAINNAATLNGNTVTSITQNAMTACCHGASVVVAISNGENGNNGPDAANPNPVNPTPPNQVFSDIGNASGKLEDGNVIRFSAWFRSDPASPITAEPQVAPVLKIEYWTSPFTGNQDTNATQIFPNFGDRLFDQDQQGYAIAQIGGTSDPPSYVDINGDGSVIHDAGFPPQASIANGRLAGLATDHWTLATATHTVNVNDFLGIGAAGYGAFSTADIEAVQGVMFLGEFSTTPVAGPGNLLVDNVLIEVFKDAASVTPINNPDPVLSEMTGLQGDFNGDNWVNAADYTTWRNGLGSTYTPADYDVWKSHFGEHSPGAGGVAGSSAVPEPATLLLIVITLLGNLTSQRLKRFTR